MGSVILMASVDDMAERVAQAMFKRDPSVFSVQQGVPWDDLGRRDRDALIEVARVAVQEIANAQGQAETEAET